MQFRRQLERRQFAGRAIQIIQDTAVGDAADHLRVFSELCRSPNHSSLYISTYINVKSARNDRHVLLVCSQVDGADAAFDGQVDRCWGFAEGVIYVVVAVAR